MCPPQCSQQGCRPPPWHRVCTPRIQLEAQGCLLAQKPSPGNGISTFLLFVSNPHHNSLARLSSIALIRKMCCVASHCARQHRLDLENIGLHKYCNIWIFVTSRFTCSVPWASVMMFSGSKVATLAPSPNVAEVGEGQRRVDGAQESRHWASVWWRICIRSENHKQRYLLREAWI